MSESRRLPPPAARRKFLSEWAHDLRSLVQAQSLSVLHLQNGGAVPDGSLLDHMSAGMEQMGFAATNFIEAAYACVGEPLPAKKVVVDELLRSATAGLGDLVTLEPSQIVVEASSYALARTTREMVFLLSRTQVARHLRVTAAAVGGRLTIEVVAGDGPVLPNARRLREQLDGTFSTLHSLTGVVVSVKRDGRGLRAVFRVGQIGGNTRPLVLVLAGDPSLAREVTRACRGTGVDVKAWSTSVPLLVTLQELDSPSVVAACVLDAGVSDDWTERLYHAIGREAFRGRVFVVRDDDCRAADAFGNVGAVVAQAGLARALKALLNRAPTR